MALNIVSSSLRRQNLIKQLYQSVKQASSKTSLAYAIEKRRNNIIIYDYNQIISKGLGCPRSYSLKTIQESNSDYRQEHNITVIGDNIPNAIRDINNSEFPEYIKEFLKREGFSEPTIIQSQAWPIAMSGQNFVGIAQTGTGKTLAYLIPAAIQLKEKKEAKGRGPRALILAPTRELARQIEQVAKNFEKQMSLRCLCIYGGVSRGKQADQLQSGVDILIATPGRLNDFLDSKVTNLSRCRYVVLDEADRMLDMGFEPQIRQALEGVPLERQVLMFSATWPKEVQHLAKDYLGEYVQVNVGSTDLSANHNIQQHVYVCDYDEKMEKFNQIMHNISGEGFEKVLVFTNTKRFVESLTLALKRNGYQAVCIHGDKTQMQRDHVINLFKSGRSKILVATDVAARGLDVDGVTHVINYDFPNTSEDYIHRIGRTGRLQKKGESHTILTSEDGRLAKSLIAVLKEANQEVPNELQELARGFSHSKIKERESRYRPRQYDWNSNRKWNKYSSNRY